MKSKIAFFILTTFSTIRSAEVSDYLSFANLKVICSVLVETGAQIDICEDGSIVCYPRNLPSVQRITSPEEKNAYLNRICYKISCIELQQPFTKTYIETFLNQNDNPFDKGRIRYYVFPEDTHLSPYQHPQEIYELYRKDYSKYGL